MTKYILYKNDREIKNAREIKVGCTLDNDNDFSVILEQYDNKDKVLNFLKQKDNRTSVINYGKYYLVEEYYVTEAEVDNNGNIICEYGIVEYSNIEIKVITNKGKLLGIVDNYIEAEEIKDNYDKKHYYDDSYSFANIYFEL